MNIDISKPRLSIALVIKTPVGTMQTVYHDIDAAIQCLIAVELAMEYLCMTKNSEEGHC